MSFWIIRVPRSSKNVCDFNVIEAYDSRELPTRLKSCPLRIGEVGMTTNAEQPHRESDRRSKVPDLAGE